MMSFASPPFCKDPPSPFAFDACFLPLEDASGERGESAAARTLTPLPKGEGSKRKRGLS